jgi:hypothetical protein
MHHSSGSKLRRVWTAAAATAGLCVAGVAGAAANPDFTDPAIVMSTEAVIQSGTCIAKFAVRLDDQSRPAAQIGQRIARHCATQISRSAGLASWMAGKPQDFAKNLKYAQEDLTTNAVLRHRESAKRLTAG